MILPVACLVEGQGEVSAVPILIRRLFEVIEPAVYPSVQRPIRIKRNRVVASGELEKAVDFAIRGLPSPGVVLLLLDSDDDCPKELAPSLLARAVRTSGGRRLVSVVLAKCEFESWFIAAADSIAGHAGLRDDLTAPSTPEAIRGAKGWLQHRMQPGRTYSETVDQPSLAAKFDLTAARQAPSFDKLYREVERFCRYATAPE